LSANQYAPVVPETEVKLGEMGWGGGLWVVEVGTVEKILSGCCGNGLGQLKVRDLLLLGIGLDWS